MWMRGNGTPWAFGGKSVKTQLSFYTREHFFQNCVLQPAASFSWNSQCPCCMPNLKRPVIATPFLQLAICLCANRQQLISWRGNDGATLAKHQQPLSTSACMHEVVRLGQSSAYALAVLRPEPRNSIRCRFCIHVTVARTHNMDASLWPGCGTYL